MNPIDVDALVARAASARELAYAPYSEFPMGAAVVTDTGTMYPGTLVENVSLGLAMCPERVAMFTAVASGDSGIVGVALVSKRTGDEITMPCGACCQVALELGGGDVVVAAADLDGVTVRSTIHELLPRGPKKD